MTQFLQKLRGWLSKLAFWRKPTPLATAHPEAEAEASAATVAEDVEPTTEAPAAKLGLLARLKSLFTFRRRQAAAVADSIEEDAVIEQTPRKANHATDEPEEPETPAPKLSFFTQLKQWLRLAPRPLATDAEADPDAENVAEQATSKENRATSEGEEADAEPTKLGFFARVKQWLRFRRKPLASDAEAEADDKTQVIDKAAARSEPSAEGEEEAPPPSRVKQFLLRLCNKWVWIPAVSLAVVGLVSWVLVIVLHTTQEKERLQVELKAAKKMLEQKPVAAVAPPKPVAAPPPPEKPEKPEKKIDPAFQIVGHVPAAQPEEAAGIDAADCLVKDKESVSENLKNCIMSFNEAVASAPQKTKKSKSK